MKRFTLQSTGETLGVTFSGDNGRAFFQSAEEKKLMWNSLESEIVEEDESFEMTMKDFMDEMLNLSQASDEEMLRRGWKEDRLESGLGFQTCISDEGKLFFKS